MNHALLLSVLKYLGFAVAAGSTIWGLTRKTTVEDAGGKKRLTAAGHVAVALAAFSGITGMLAYGLEQLTRGQDRLDRIEQTQRLILASQPLRTLSFSIRIEGFSSEQRQQLADGMDNAKQLTSPDSGDVGDITGYPFEKYRQEVIRSYVLYPFFQSLGQEPPATGDAILLIELDASGSVILSLGATTGDSFAGYIEQAQYLRQRVLSSAAYYSPGIDGPAYQNLGNCPMPSLIIPDTYEYIKISGTATADCLSNILQLPPGTFASTVFAPELRAVLVTAGSQGLPFSPENVRQTEFNLGLCWRGKVEVPQDDGLRLTIELIPNNEQSGERRYYLRQYPLTNSLEVRITPQDDPLDYGSCVAFARHVPFEGLEQP